MNQKTNKIIVLVGVILAFGIILGVLIQKQTINKTKEEIEKFLIEFRTDAVNCVQPISQSLNWRERWDLECWDKVAKKYTTGEAYAVAMKEKQMFIDKASLNFYQYQKFEIKSLVPNVLKIDLKKGEAVGETILDVVYFYSQRTQEVKVNDVLKLKKINGKWYITQIGDFYDSKSF